AFNAGFTRTAVGYPVAQPDGTTLKAPAARPADTLFRAGAISPAGKVVVSAYISLVVSPWQTCASGPAPPVGRITCDTLGNYIDNARLFYILTDLGTGSWQFVGSQSPINTRYGFGAGSSATTPTLPSDLMACSIPSGP